MRIILWELLGTVHAFLSNCSYSYWKRRFQNSPKLSEEIFREILTNELGVKQGLVVFVHSSINMMNIDFPFYRVLALLREIVGEEGTLLFPSMHLSAGGLEKHLKSGGVFDVKKSPTTMGIIPEFARRQKGAYRSLHPTNSVCAIGRWAKDLTDTHHRSPYPFGEESPYYKIANYDGIIIGLGVSTKNLTFVHCVDDALKDSFPVKTRRKKLFEGKVVGADGQTVIVKTFLPNERTLWRDIPRYIRKYIPEKVCRDMQINDVQFFTANAGALFKEMSDLAQQGIIIYSKFL